MATSASGMTALTVPPARPSAAGWQARAFVTGDNDLSLQLPTKINVFAVDGAAAKISYVPQELPKRIFPKARIDRVIGSQAHPAP